MFFLNLDEHNEQRVVLDSWYPTSVFGSALLCSIATRRSSSLLAQGAPNGHDPYPPLSQPHWPVSLPMLANDHHRRLDETGTRPPPLSSKSDTYFR